MMMMMIGEIRTRVVVICDLSHYQLDHGGAYGDERWHLNILAIPRCDTIEIIIL